MPERKHRWLEKISRHFSPPLNEAELQIRHQAAVQVAEKLRQTQPWSGLITGAYLFGSMATGKDAKRSSDIDLAVITEEDLFRFDDFPDISEDLNRLAKKYLGAYPLPKVIIHCTICPRMYLDNPDLLTTNYGDWVRPEKVLEVFRSVKDIGVKIFDSQQTIG